MQRSSNEGWVLSTARAMNCSISVVTPEGLVKVRDFGLAERSEKDLLEGATQPIGQLDTAQGLTGTLQYMAPEMLRGLETDHRIDIWALGVVLYEAASGQLPFKGRPAFEISSAILHALPPQLPSRAPTGLCAIIHPRPDLHPRHSTRPADQAQ